MNKREKLEYLSIAAEYSTAEVDQKEAELNELLKQISNDDLRLDIDDKIGEIITAYQYMAYEIGRKRRRVLR